jgi:phospholipase/carboxylesterase
MNRSEPYENPVDPHALMRVSSAGVPPERGAGAVVLLHGRGRIAEDILALAVPLAFPDFTYLAPQAAARTWYPDRFLAPLEDNEPALSSALRGIDRLVAGLGAAGIGPERIVFVGFSQGACLAAEYVARRPRRYGGVAALIGGLFGPEGSRLDYEGYMDGTPVFLCTSDPDPFVPPVRVRETADVLRDMGAQVTLQIQEGTKHVITEEGRVGARDLIESLAASPATGRAFASSSYAKAPARPRAPVEDRPRQIHPTVLPATTVATSRR